MTKETDLSQMPPKNKTKQKPVTWGAAQVVGMQKKQVLWSASSTLWLRSAWRELLLPGGCGQTGRCEGSLGGIKGHPGILKKCDRFLPEFNQSKKAYMASAFVNFLPVLMKAGQSMPVYAHSMCMHTHKWNCFQWAWGCFIYS